ncbi:hypothetical protein EDB84DRAFT_983584 [Lactarius hengduanensis]|nr:hypothetical protein EDB84DRAFT_983584 [Lactarius hengduanensis]
MQSTRLNRLDADRARFSGYRHWRIRPPEALQTQRPGTRAMSVLVVALSIGAGANRAGRAGRSLSREPRPEVAFTSPGSRTGTEKGRDRAPYRRTTAGSIRSRLKRSGYVLHSHQAPGMGRTAPEGGEQWTHIERVSIFGNFCDELFAALVS